MPNKWKRCWKKSINEIQKRKIYKSTNKRLTNKIKKVKKHLKKCPNDLQNKNILNNLK